MKRRNVEGGKLRRPIKRTKITDSLYGSTFIYLKFLALWGFVLMADYLLEFRFEFLWPFWLLLRSVYDSFKYQGLAFSVLFVCVAATSDMICFFFIPVHWLFFLASTYVWVQYVWHTEKGVCLPTVALCILFVYVEAAVRMREFKQPPFHMDLCRPFAAHCIGYPVVTFGFGFKSYVGYRMRQRRQREVAKENEFYMELLQQALPPRPDPPAIPQTVAIISTLPDKSSRVVCITPNDPDGKLPNGLVVNGIPITPAVPNGTARNNHRKNVEKTVDRDKNDDGRKVSHVHTNGSVNKLQAEEAKKGPVNGSATTDLDYIERVHNVNDFDANEPEKEKVSKGCNNRSQEKSGKWGPTKPQEPTSTCLKEKKGRSNKETQEPNNGPVKDELIQRLEADVKRLKADLQASRQVEQDLRSQLNASVAVERITRQDLSQLQSCNDDLQNRVHGLVTARQSDKQSLAALEKRLGDERRVRAGCEAQLAAERKTKRQEETALAVMASALNKAECTESCRQRRRELDSESKALRREVKLKDERMSTLEREVQSLRQYKEAQSDTEILMSALAAMQEKNGLLENGLKAETRIKLDLFSALGEAKRQLEIREGLIRSQEKELEELKGKMAQVLAVMPSETFCPSPPVLSGTSSKFRLGDSHLHCFSSTVEDDYSAMSTLRSLTETPVSTLDPNATAYTPKGNMVTSTEA